MIAANNFLVPLKRGERFILKVRAMCGVKLVNKRNTVELMDMLGLKEAADKLAIANGIRWYGHVLRRPEEDVLMKAIVHKVDGKRKQDGLRIKWRDHIEGLMRRIGLRKKDVADRCRWREGVRRIAEVVGCIRLPPFTGDRSKYWMN